MRGFHEPDEEALRAACRGAWVLFDAVESVDGKDYYPHLAEAKVICETQCPVFDWCKEKGNGERTGIWAGEAK